jgi:protein O-GlcNAc transferase
MENVDGDRRVNRHADSRSAAAGWNGRRAMKLHIGRWVRLGVAVLCVTAVWGCSRTATPAFERHYETALQQTRAGHHTQAIAEYREALKLRPASADTHDNLGALLYDVGETDAAIQEYRRALWLNPDLAAAHNNLGVALLSTAQTAAAVGEYREAVELKADFTEARYNLCLGLELLGQLPEALTQCRMVVEQEPARPGGAAAVKRLQEKLGVR